MPEERRPVIDSASLYVSVPAGEDVTARLFANGPPGTIFGTQHFVLSPQGTSSGKDVLTGNHTMPLCAGKGDGNVTFQVGRAGNVVGGTMTADVSVVGYLEDLP